jgi:hypothetical protein
MRSLAGCLALTQACTGVLDMEERGTTGTIHGPWMVGDWNNSSKAGEIVPGLAVQPFRLFHARTLAVEIRHYGWGTRPSANVPLPWRLEPIVRHISSLSRGGRAICR